MTKALAGAIGNGSSTPETMVTSCLVSMVKRAAQLALIRRNNNHGSVMMKRVNYDEVSAVYDQRYRHGGPVGIAKSLQELAHKVEARRVLEVGCGTGHWLMLMQNCEIRCGLDYSAGMLDKARQRDRSLGLIRGTATQLPFCEGAFDFVLCVHALHHFDDPPAFIYEARCVLRTGGALAIIGMDPQTEQDRWYLYDYFPGTYETDLARYPSGDMILHWMKAAGFVACKRRIAARIEHDFIGREVLSDPVLQKNGTSQLLLLTEDAFMNGMARIREAIQLAERRGEEIVFPTHIALPIVVGFVPDAVQSFVYEARPKHMSADLRQACGLTKGLLVRR